MLDGSLGIGSDAAPDGTALQARGRQGHRRKDGDVLNDYDECSRESAGPGRSLRFLFAAAGAWALMTGPVYAQGTPLPPVTVGAGMQTSYTHDSAGSDTNMFALNSVRLYVNGSPTDKIRFEFNTEYDGPGNHVIVLDAVAKFEFSPKVNIWAGRMLPPSDRANLAGPYFANNWATFTDGVEDGYPFVADGRDNGAAYWGQFGIMKVSAGLFDGPSANGINNVIGAGRVQFDFWDPEPGYYLNRTYYGDRNILAIAAAAQVQDSTKAYDVDGLVERKMPGGGAVTVEGEFAKYNRLGGYNAQYGEDRGGFILGSYLFPPALGLTGRFEVLGKFAHANFSDGITAQNPNYSQTTTEGDLNYIISNFRARIMVYFLNKSFNAVMPNDTRFGIGLQLQM
jgi:hypothetical protein